MDRRYLTNEKNYWFDAARATRFKEEAEHDGRNFISVNTGSQFEHESLYLTAGGKFILREYSDWQGKMDTYREIEKMEAILWLYRNSHEEIAARLDEDRIITEYEL